MKSMKSSRFIAVSAVVGLLASIAPVSPVSAAAPTWNGVLSDGAETLTVSEEADTLITASASGTTIIYSLNTSGEPDWRYFSINNTTGDLTWNTGATDFSNGPDHENPLDAGANNSYIVTINARDTTNELSVDAIITVNVTDVQPTLDDSGSTYSIPEETNATVWTANVLTPDSDWTPVYSLSGLDAAFFVVDTATGVVTWKPSVANPGIGTTPATRWNGSPNFEDPADVGPTNNVYTFTVYVQFGIVDGGSPISTDDADDSVVVEISVTDINPFVKNLDNSSPENNDPVLVGDEADRLDQVDDDVDLRSERTVIAAAGGPDCDLFAVGVGDSADFHDWTNTRVNWTDFMGYQRDMLNWLPNHEAPLDSYFLWNNDVAGDPAPTEENPDATVPYIGEPADDNVYVCRYTVNIYDTLGTVTPTGDVLDVAAKTMVVGRLDLASSYDYEVRVTVQDADEGDGLSVSVRSTTSGATVTATPVDGECEAPCSFTAEVDKRSSEMEWGSGDMSVVDENANSIPRFSHVRFELQAQEGYAFEICGSTCTGANIETSDFANYEHPLEYTGGNQIILAYGGEAGSEAAIDPFIWLFDANKDLIAFDDDGGAGYNAEMMIPDLPIGSYSFIVADFDCALETGLSGEGYIDILDYEDLVECVEDDENWGDGSFTDLTRTIDVMFNERSASAPTALFGGLLPSTQYRVRAYLIVDHQVQTDPTDFIVFTTPALAGPVGPKGDTGDAGNDGAPGTDGTNGTNGAPGTDGTNGTNGAPGGGSAGPAGPAGPAGSAGPAGPAGAPGLPGIILRFDGNQSNVSDRIQRQLRSVSDQIRTADVVRVAVYQNGTGRQRAVAQARGREIRAAISKINPNAQVFVRAYAASEKAPQCASYLNRCGLISLERTALVAARS